MARARSLANSGIDLPTPQAWNGKVETGATQFGEGVFVSIEAFDDPGGKTWLHGPCLWVSQVKKDGVYFPKKGCNCCILLPEDGDPWIAAWEVKDGADPDEAF